MAVCTAEGEVVAGAKAQGKNQAWMQIWEPSAYGWMAAKFRKDKAPIL